ncbi:MAG: NAD(P)-dependent oxidoreductase [Verrucomicrobia bacterium]|nr:NAD(P)-dependent oxidoreductase [Verrucomicrobiota bacterium]
MTPTFLVTGGSGFIGTWVVRRLLEQRFGVVVYDLHDGGERWRQLLGASAEQVTLIRGDLLDGAKLAAAFDTHAVTHVIHLGAWLTPACQENPYRGCEINVLGTMRVFEAVRAWRERIKGFAYASSIAVYGSELDDPPAGATRNPALEPETFYGVFKRTTEMLAGQYWRHFGIASVGLRPYVVYGPGRESGLSAGPTLAARAVARGESFRFGFSGAAGFEFVADTARALVRAALEPPNGAVVADLSGEQATVEEIIRLLDRLRPGAAARLAVAGEPLPCLIAPGSLVIRDLFPDWQTTSLTEGLRRTVEFYENVAQLAQARPNEKPRAAS